MKFNLFYTQSGKPLLTSFEGTEIELKKILSIGIIMKRD
jgi:hypothetical protein